MRGVFKNQNHPENKQMPEPTQGYRRINAGDTMRFPA
jgi:hypothetical protein